MKEGGGGVGIMIKAGLSVKQLPAKHFESFEHTIVCLPLVNKKKLFLVAIYRVQFVSEKVFFTELAELLDEIVVSNEHYVIAGDVNIHMETSDGHAKQLRELLDLYDTNQHIDKPTHEDGHTLDVIFAPNRAD